MGDGETQERFAFGKNWADFLSLVDEDRIKSSTGALLEKLPDNDLSGLTFLDVGSGSGLSSLAACRLGARVTSFDADDEAVECNMELRRRYALANQWRILQGSVLDEQFLGTLGQFDYVYSWGVLHHTGAMWTAIDNVARLVKPGGVLWLAIYNDQGLRSRVWHAIKKTYNRSPDWIRHLLVFLVGLYFRLRSTAAALVTLHGSRTDRGMRSRGMSRHHDLVDWVGGYPFEVAKPEEVFYFLKARGFRLEELKTCGPGFACNEFVARLDAE